MTKTSTEFITPFRQWLSLILACMFLGSTLFWVAWLYFRSRDDVEQMVSKSFTQSKLLAQELVVLKKRELDALAQGLVNSPLLKSALATNDRKTIIDVLSSNRQKNQLDFIGLVHGKELVYADSLESDAGLKAQVATRWVGKAGLDMADKDNWGLLIAKNISSEDLIFWERLLGAKMLFLRSDGSNIISSENLNLNFSAGEISDIRAKVFSITRNDEYYMACYPLLGDTIDACPLINKKSFWLQFTRLKNKLLILGAGLGLLGLILGPLLALIFSRQLDLYLQNRAQQSGQYAQDILKQIEELKQNGRA
jgi:hypothetical protein